MAPDFIPLFRPDCGKRELREISKAFKSGWLGLGPQVARLESKLSAMMKGRDVVTLSSCTWALDHLLKLYGARNKRVLLPSLTYIASAHPLLYNKCRPVWIDVEPETLCMDPDDLARKIKKGDGAVMPVHYGGNPCRMNEILEISHDHGVSVIEDAAHAFGSVYNGKPIGSFGDATAFSFHATKSVTAGDGGAVSLQDSDMAQKLTAMRSLGIQRSTWERVNEDEGDYWDFECETYGYKTYMNDVAASIAIAQLANLKKYIAAKKKLTLRYEKKLADIPEISFLGQTPKSSGTHYHFVMKAKMRSALIRHLYKKGIAAGVHYRPVHHHKAYKKFKANVPETEKAFREIVTLPLFSTLKQKEQDRVISAVREFYSSLRY